MKRNDAIRVTYDDMWFFMLSQVRYAMGRRSYITATTRDLYHRYKGALEPWQRLQIAEEIETEIRIAERHTSRPYLGDRCDHEIWVSLAREIREEDEGQGKE